MALQSNQAYIAITENGYVDGACFSENEHTGDWLKDMYDQGYTLAICDRQKARDLIGKKLDQSVRCSLSV